MKTPHLSLAAILGMLLLIVPAHAEKSLAEKAVANPNLTTLVAALKAADLVETVANGDFTVLAPSNAAFEKLPAGTLASLLEPENKAQLQTILKYHLLPNGFTPADMLASGSVDTVEGRAVNVSFVDGRILVNDAVLLAAGEKSRRGTIHLIDTVLLPPAAGSGNIVETAQAAGSFKTLLAAATAAGLVDALSGEGPLTVFAPTDAAFAKLPKGTVAQLVRPENKQQLVDILKYHVVPGKVRAGDALNAGEAATLQGSHVAISYEDGGLKVGDARILTVDVEASNGIIHVIDSVLLPPKTSAQRAMTLIHQAIAKGVPTYNHGDAAGCASIYMSASMTLLKDNDLPKHGMRAIQHAVHAASQTQCHDTRSWTLREGLDQAYLALVAQAMAE